MGYSSSRFSKICAMSMYYVCFLVFKQISVISFWYSPQNPLCASKICIHTCLLRSPTGTLGRADEREHSSDMAWGNGILTLSRLRGIQGPKAGLPLGNHQALALQCIQATPEPETSCTTFSNRNCQSVTITGDSTFMCLFSVNSSTRAWASWYWKRRWRRRAGRGHPCQPVAMILPSTQVSSRPAAFSPSPCQELAHRLPKLFRERQGHAWQSPQCVLHERK